MAEFLTVFGYTRVEPIVNKDLTMKTKFAQALTDLINNSNIVPSAIEENTDNIAQNASDISDNATDIGNNTLAINDVTTNFNNHNASDSEHGVTGDNVGTGDFATDILGGVVRLAALVADASVTSVAIATADIGAAPVAYSQAYAQEQTDLINEEKAVINTLVTDVTDAIDQLNAFLAANKTALQMSTV